MLTLILGAVLFTGGATAAPVLFEAYQEGTISIPGGSNQTTEVVKISFSVDTSCYALFTTGGSGDVLDAWLEADGDSLPPIVRIAGGDEGPIPISYTYLLSPGEHEIVLYIIDIGQVSPATCKKAYLQALVFLPDEASAITEQPASDNGLKPIAPSAVISKGPYVTVTGATELVDSTGRIIENAIAENRVYINNLPMGTYFARDGEQTVVKIVKVQ